MNRFGRSDFPSEATHKLVNGLGRSRLADFVRRDLDKGVQSAEEFVVDKPVLGLCLGFMVGMFIGYLAKRS